jgi:hypothetical protein
MRDTLALFFALVLLLTIGATLFADGSYVSDSSQTARIIGGATFLSAGLASMWFALKNWLKWKRFYKEYRDE